MKAASPKSLVESVLPCQTQPSSTFGRTHAGVFACVCIALLQWLRAASAGVSEANLGGTDTSPEVTRQALRARATDFFSSSQLDILFQVWDDEASFSVSVFTWERPWCEMVMGLRDSWLGCTQGLESI